MRLAGTGFSLGLGIFLYLLTLRWISEIPGEEVRVLANRMSLLLVWLPLAAASQMLRSPLVKYWRKPDWNAQIRVPFIWRGARRTSVKQFFSIAITANTAAFLPFTLRGGWQGFLELCVFALLFAVINAFLEELIWRGTLLGLLSEKIGEGWASVVTSLGFGLFHLTIGYPIGICLAFAVGGMYFAGVTVKSNSIFPAMLWHMVLNALMVFSGLIP